MILSNVEYEEAVARALAADTAYYVHDRPLMSDTEYDKLVKSIAEFEQNTGYKLEYSPTQRVGGAVSGAFQKVRHPRRMLSLDNVFNKDEVDKFCRFVHDEGRTGFIVEPKLDGLTLVCHYDGGLLVQAVTRGDGDVGEDVTATARTIRNLPLKIATPFEFWARGEVIIEKADFEAVNETMVRKGQPPFANPRNAAAGSLRQKDPKQASERRLLICFYDLYTDGKPMDELLKLVKLEACGLPTLRSASTVCDESAEVFEACQAFNEARGRFPFEIDGAVVKAIEGPVQASCGEGNKTPKWAVAYKFPAEHVESTLRAVRWQVGRTGRLTPVADIDPVQIAGTTVEHASLHNIEYINAMQLRIGDTVSVYKAAEIIPQIAGVLRHGEGHPVPEPAQCPVCGGEVEREGPEIRCVNAGCPAKAKAQLEFFGEREHMDIRGLGPAVVDALFDIGIGLPDQLYTLKKDTLLLLDGFSDKKAQALIDAIEKSKERPFDRVLASLGVDMLGDTLSTAAARKFGSMDKVLAAKEADWMELDGVAKTTAETIVKGFRERPMPSVIRGLREAGLHMQVEDNGLRQTLKDKSFCVTGTLSVGREEVKALILSRGGIFQSGVSSKTDYLVVGEKGGSKADKARKLGVKTIDETELRRMAENG